jgi:hypothetical protein
MRAPARHLPEMAYNADLGGIRYFLRNILYFIGFYKKKSARFWPFPVGKGAKAWYGH